MKRNKRFGIRWKPLSLVMALLLSLGLAVGCYVEVEDHGPGPSPAPFLADLQVDWRIQGSQSANYCSAYDIASWIVEVNGPEYRESVIDCRAHWWSSENDFLSLSEGTYTVTVTAVDPLGYTLAKQSSVVDLLDLGYTDQLTFQFYASDFGF